jgi:hypothetical protein
VSGPPPSDVRSLPTATLNLYLYGIGAWGALLLVLLLMSRIEAALPLTYVVAIWQGALTLWWGPSMLKKFREGELTRGEADAGVRSVGRLLAASAMLPAIVFLARDPLEPNSWMATVSILAVSMAAYFGAGAVTKLSNPWTHTGILVVAWLALPINATGAVTFAAAFGLFDKLLH